MQIAPPRQELPLPPEKDKEGAAAIPTIWLSFYQVIQEAEASVSPLEDAKPLPESYRSMRQIEVAGELVKSDLALQLNPIRRERAAFLSATVVKKRKSEALGLNFTESSDGVLRISSTILEGLFADAPFRTGDVLVSINKKNCKGLKRNRIDKLLRSTRGFLTIVVENPKGDPKLVESMVVKPHPDYPTGLGLAKDCSRYVHISSVKNRQIFAESLISRKDLILSVNGISCEYYDCKAVARIIRYAEKNVTIMAERKDHSAVVMTSMAA